METALSKDVQEKLDIINWDSLKDKYGISRDTFYNNLPSQRSREETLDLQNGSEKERNPYSIVSAWIPSRSQSADTALTKESVSLVLIIIHHLLHSTRL